MKTFISFIESSVKWKKPKHHDEHDEIHTQSKEKPGTYPDHVHHMLNKLKDKKSYTKHMRKGKKMTVTRDSTKKMSNTDASYGFSDDQDSKKRKRVDSHFKKGKVTKPIVLHDKDTGHTHLVAGNTRLTHNTHVNKKNTPVHAITYSSAKNKAKAQKAAKKLKEAHSINKQNVPVYVPVPGKRGHHKVVGHVRRNATSVGAAKVAKSRSAFMTMKLVSPEYPEGPGWIAKK